MFKNYEEYTKAFNTEDKREEAILLLEIQNWIIQFIQNNKIYDDYYYNLDNFLNSKWINNENKKDFLSPIFEIVESPSKKIFSQLKNKIIKVNEMIPVYKAKELNSSSVNWISKLPGKTLKSKIKNSTSILAPVRKFSYDTGENRLFLEFCKRLKLFLENKLDVEKQQFEGIKQIEIYLIQLNKFLNSEEIKEIKRWENLPPNNTLLSDQYYKKIWSEWKNLNKVDSMIENISKNIDDKLLIIIYFELIYILQDYFEFIQQPIKVHYENFEIEIIGNDTVIGYNKSTLEEINIIHSRKNIIINFLKQTIVLELRNKKVIFQINGKEKRKIFNIVEITDLNNFIKKEILSILN